jgi:SAM-dependent methyltransferase
MSETEGRKNWQQIWAARTLDPAKGSTLAQLMAADGLDTGFGNVSEAAWLRFIGRAAVELELAKGSEVFEVGCGAGAFLYDLDARGYAVCGIDPSEALVAYARAAIPRGRFEVADASTFDEAEQADAVVSCAVFLYFPSPDYASAVIGRMAAKARHAVALFDVPDAALQDEALAVRRGHLGSEAYEARYRGLDHLYFDREWVRNEFERRGLERVRIESQQIDGYTNGAFRFNAIGFKRQHPGT